MAKEKFCMKISATATTTMLNRIRQVRVCKCVCVCVCTRCVCYSQYWMWNNIKLRECIAVNLLENSFFQTLANAKVFFFVLSFRSLNLFLCFSVVHVLY